MHRQSLAAVLELETTSPYAPSKGPTMSWVQLIGICVHNIDTHDDAHQYTPGLKANDSISITHHTSMLCLSPKLRVCWCVSLSSCQPMHLARQQHSVCVFAGSAYGHRCFNYDMFMYMMRTFVINTDVTASCIISPVHRSVFMVSYSCHVVFLCVHMEYVCQCYLCTSCLPVLFICHVYSVSGVAYKISLLVWFSKTCRRISCCTLSSCLPVGHTVSKSIAFMFITMSVLYIVFMVVFMTMCLWCVGASQ